MTALAYQHDHNPSPHEEIEIYEIAHLMKKENLPDKFVASAVKTALLYEGVADLLKLWRDEIIADIQELIDDCKVHELEKSTYIKINDLKSIATDIRTFKDSLLIIVNQKGGITQLSKITGVPQPSLSRFFNSNAMPRRSTLLKIATALNLDAVKINTVRSR